MKSPKDKIGNVILKGDIVQLTEPMIGLVTDIKVGGMIIGGQPILATVVVRGEVTVEVTPGGIAELVVLKRPGNTTEKAVVQES